MEARRDGRRRTCEPNACLLRRRVNADAAAGARAIAESLGGACPVWTGTRCRPTRDRQTRASRVADPAARMHWRLARPRSAAATAAFSERNPMPRSPTRPRSPRAALALLALLTAATSASAQSTGNPKGTSAPTEDSAPKASVAPRPRQPDMSGADGGKLVGNAAQSRARMQSSRPRGSGTAGGLPPSDQGAAPPDARVKQGTGSPNTRPVPPSR